MQVTVIQSVLRKSAAIFILYVTKAMAENCYFCSE